MSATNKRPDWAFWANMGEVRLWQAIALSLDIEPRWLSAGGEPPSAVPGVFDRRPAGFAERLQVAGSHLPSLETFPTWNGRDAVPVRLAVVRRWGESLPVPWTFPSGFPLAEGEGIKRHWVTGAPGTPVKPAAAVASGTEVHSTKGKKRRDDLWPAIEAAQQKARAQGRNPQDTAAVWVILASMADEEESPMLAATSQGIKWKRGGEVAYLTRDALHKRLHP